MASETEVLRSRLEEQSELIMLLKRRAESAEGQLEATARAQDGSNRDKHRIVSLEGQLKLLQEQFDTLSSNHEKLIAFKDDYKRQNSNLRAENKALRDEALAQDTRIAAAVLDATKDTSAVLAATKTNEQVLQKDLALATQDIQHLKLELQAEKAQHAAAKAVQESQRQHALNDLTSTRKSLETQISKLQSQLEHQQQQCQSSSRSL